MQTCMYANACITNRFIIQLLLYVSAIFKYTIPVLQEGAEDFYSLLIAVKE